MRSLKSFGTNIHTKKVLCVCVRVEKPLSGPDNSSNSLNVSFYLEFLLKSFMPCPWLHLVVSIRIFRTGSGKLKSIQVEL